VLISAVYSGYYGIGIMMESSGEEISVLMIMEIPSEAPFVRKMFLA